MTLQELARLQRLQEAAAASAGDPAALPPHLAEQARRIERGYGYPELPDMPGARDGWTR